MESLNVHLSFACSLLTSSTSQTDVDCVDLDMTSNFDFEPVPNDGASGFIKYNTGKERARELIN